MHSDFDVFENKFNVVILLFHVCLWYIYIYLNREPTNKNFTIIPKVNFIDFDIELIKIGKMCLGNEVVYVHCLLIRSFILGTRLLSPPNNVKNSRRSDKIYVIY